MGKNDAAFYPRPSTRASHLLPIMTVRNPRKPGILIITFSTTGRDRDKRLLCGKYSEALDNLNLP
jgi:hypothetical protein